MDEQTYEFLFNNLSFKQDCGCLLDRKTRARIRREDRQTWKALKNLERIREEKALELRERERQKDGKEETKQDKEGDKEIKHYRFTKWSKMKIRRLRSEKEKVEAYLDEYRKQTFFTRIIELRDTMLRQEWNRTCHLKERKIIRENIRLKNILRIRLKYDIDNTLPSDSIIFDKLLNHEREKKKQMKLRQERMVKIIEKITREMTNGIRLVRRARLKEMRLKESSDGSLAEISFEEILSISEDSTLAKESLKEPSETEKTVPELTEPEHKIKNSKHIPEETEIVQDDKGVEAEKEKVISEHDFKKFIKLKESRSSTEQVFPSDKCFFATPSTVTFENFKVNNVYSRKVTITNKTARWAYLRYHKVYTEVWEPGVVEIDIMDAARIKPGLHVTVNVKFSPVHEEEVRAVISFFTLNCDDRKMFHQFYVPVRCTPELALPVLHPKELQFPSASIWKYAHSKYNERTLSITNEGNVSFSIALEERNGHENCFLWYFDQEKLQSANSSMLRLTESESEETNGERDSDDISDKQNSRKMYQIEVPPKIKCDLRIIFKPRYVGLHHEVLEISFLSNNSIFDKQSVPIWAEVTGHQIHLDPPCVDLGIVMIDASICQQTFSIINTGRTTVKVLTKTPKCLGNQVSVRPKFALVQSETCSKVTVKLMPESSITCISKRFYDSLSNILEFPIHVQIISQDEENPPPLILKVLASLTTCHGLVLVPAQVNLGRVYTHESVYAELNLTNESLLIQEYAFLNLPPSMEIQPNDGFGAILPGETVKLHLIYSPYPRDIPGNELGANGISGERRFLIQVVTLAELAGSKKRSIINRLKNQASMLLKVSKSSGSPPPVPIELKKSERIAELESGEFENDSDAPLNRAEEDSVISQEHICDEEEIVAMPIEISNDNDRRKSKSSMEVHVYIVDTFCELSEQIVQFCATPCGSFNKASVHLRGFNLASYPNCTCGIVKNQKKEFTARYEFESSSDRVQIVPQRGTLNSNEFTEVNFIFKPRLPRSIIFEEGHRLNVNIVEQETKSEKTEKKGRARKVTQKETPDGKKNVSEVDEFAGENSLLETFEPCISTIFITCKIDVEMKNGVKYNEQLYAKLICPIAKPEIIVLNENRVISFGSSAIGASTRQFLLVKNISNETVKVEISLLDPFGPFFVPPGKTIETGSILKLPVTYRPSQHHEEDEECFEVFSSRTRTRWTVKLSGRGVVPSYVLKPRFRVVRLEVIGNNPAEVRMSIQNTGSCPLIFRLSIIDVLEGDIPYVHDQSTQTSGRKKKMKNDTDSSKKSQTKAEFDDNLRPNEKLAIFNGNLQRSADHKSFSFWNLDESMQLLVPEKKKVDFGVQFHPRAEENDLDPQEKTDTSSSKKKKATVEKKSDQLKKSNYCQVAIIKLMLGSTTVQDFVIICSIV